MYYSCPMKTFYFFFLEIRRQHNWNTNANHNRLNLIGPTCYVTKKELFMPHDITCIDVSYTSFKTDWGVNCLYLLDWCQKKKKKKIHN